MFEFTYPWFALALVLPILVALAPAHLTRFRAVKHSHFEQFQALSQQKLSKGAVKLTPLFWQRSLVILLYLSLVLAAMRPVYWGEVNTIETQGREMLVAVDLSGSMEARDFADEEGIEQRRIDVVKNLLEEFLSQRESDRVGLIAFGDAAYLQSPFTSDFITLRQLLAEMDVRMAGPGTAIGDAIGVAVNHFEHAQTTHQTLILMTDGRDTNSNFPPIEAAHFAAEHGITIHSIAIGDPASVGEEAIDMEMLNRIADLTGGVVFEAQDASDLQQVYTQIDQLEPAVFDSYSVRPKLELYYYPIGVVLALILTALLVVLLKLSRNINKGEK
ncbi:VWA domain-containing protein [Vibrio sp. ZSDE26]|uniref:VWA domain-containing protein n=1 Tax=Vibrio amylolyticus TaxID=2847292 RepID=A0A9X1XGP9_9VIBR|nr:VWA domain-containing protein [Vibrio amylolyticus]MCK6262782.1 VWA domain-containing protein [Vibrio amylolyticus]